MASTKQLLKQLRQENSRLRARLAQKPHRDVLAVSEAHRHDAADKQADSDLELVKLNGQLDVLGRLLRDANDARDRQKIIQDGLEASIQGSADHIKKQNDEISALIDECAAKDAKIKSLIDPDDEQEAEWESLCETLTTKLLAANANLIMAEQEIASLKLPANKEPQEALDPERDFEAEDLAHQLAEQAQADDEADFNEES